MGSIPIFSIANIFFQDLVHGQVLVDLHSYEAVT